MAEISPVPLGESLPAVSHPPFPRSLAAVAYDPISAQTLMFGGLSPLGTVPDTWAWDGASWIQQHSTAAPHARNSAVMAYDPSVGGLVLVGGDPDSATTPEIDADMRATWLWRGSSWQRLSLSHTPVPQNYAFAWHALMAYDGYSHDLVLVSITAIPHDIPCVADTWTFNGVDWHHRTPSEALPATVRELVTDGPNGHVLAVLNPRPALVQQGFVTPMCAPGSHDARALEATTTFKWTGSGWYQIEVGELPASGNDGDAGSATFANHAVVVTEGGDVWFWTGAAWTLRSRAGTPPPRSFAALAQDRNGRLLMFGGIIQAPPWDLGDTWLWDGRVWLEVPVTGSVASASR